MTVVGPKNRPLAELTALKEQLQQLEGGTAKSVSAAGPDAPLPKLERQSQTAGREGTTPRIQNASAAELEAAIAKARSQLLAQLRPIIQQLEDAKIPPDPAKATLAELTAGADAIYARRNDIDRVYRMLRALPPEIQKAFPMAQLEALEKALKATQDELERFESKLKSSAAPSKSSLGASSSYGAYTFQKKPVTFPPSVLLKPEAMADLPTAAAKLASLLQDPGLGVQLTAVVPKGAEVRFAHAVKVAAVLADFVVASPDYTQGLTNTQNRRDHQARNYGYAATHAAPRQQASRTALRQEIEAALVQADPAAALESAVVRRFVAELGVPAAETLGWKPNFAAVTKALTDEVLVPLRCLNERVADSMLRSFFYRYTDEDAKRGVRVVRAMSQSIVEGRFDDWRRNLPETKLQLQGLNDAQRELFHQSHHTEAKIDGKTFTTREGEGADLFWATKTGGPSHGFDNTPYCTTALLTNVRTKVIMVQDEDFPLNAARAYLKLIDRPSGEKPILVLEGTESDFAYFGARSTVQGQILQHAVEKAKAMGLELMVLVGGYPTHKHQAVDRERSITIQPVPVVEASDYLNIGHDRPVTEPLSRKLFGPVISP